MCTRFSLSRLLKSLLILSLLNAQVGLAAPPHIELSLPEDTGCLWGFRIYPSDVTGNPVTFLADLCSAAVTPSPKTLTWQDLSAYTAATGIEITGPHLTLRNPDFELSVSYPNDAPLEIATVLLNASHATPFHLFVPADPDDSTISESVARDSITSLLDVRVLIEGPLVLHCEARQLKTSQLFQVSGLLSGLDLDVLHNQGSLLLSAVAGTVDAFINDNISRISQWSSHMTRLQNTGKLWLEKGQYEVEDLINTGTIVLGANSGTPVTDTDSSDPSGTTDTNAWTLLQRMNPALNATLVPDPTTCMAMFTVNGHVLDRPLSDCGTFQKAQSNEFLLPLLKEKALRTFCAAEGVTPVASYLKTPTLRGVFTVQGDVTLEDKLSSYPFLTLSGQGSLTFFDENQAPLSLNELENLPFASVRAFVNGPVILPHAVTIPDLTVVSSHPTCLSLLHPFKANSLALSLPCLSVGSPQILTTLSVAKLFLHTSGEQGIDFSNAKVSMGPQGGVLLAQQGPFRLGRLVSQGINPHPIFAHQSVNDECGRKNKASVWAFHRNHPSPEIFAGLSDFTEIPFQKEGWETFQGNGAGLFSAGPLSISGTNWYQEGSLLFCEKEAVFHVSGEVSILSGQIESHQSILFAGGTHFSLGRPLPTRV